jgi:hypothetical protein
MRLGDRLIPKIPVRLRYRNKEISITALIDSGADTCFIPEDIACILGINFHRGVEKKITGIDKELICTEWPLTLIIEGNCERHEIEVIAQVPKLSSKKVGVLLGREGFFENFNITFCEKAGDIYLEKTKSSEGSSAKKPEGTDYDLLREKTAKYAAKRKIKPSDVKKAIKRVRKKV